MTVYILKNGKSLSEIIEICDTSSNAEQMKENLIKTGQYKLITIESFEVSTDAVTPLEVVRITGTYNNGVANSKIFAYNATSVISDSLTFTVTGSQITYTGYVNLTTVEQADDDTDELITRINNWVVSEFKSRLEDNNPV